jgi:hypothetical protein
VRFYLGAPEPTWLFREEFRGVPLFVSHRRLAARLKNHHRRAVTTWALDSGGFSELSLYDTWKTTPAQYVEAVEQYASEIGGLEWAAPQDWMVEDVMLAKTGLTMGEHQRRTIRSVQTLRAMAPHLPFVPVLQGQRVRDYVRHAEDYAAEGIGLAAEPVVGVGSVCRRQSGEEAGRIFAALRSELGLQNLHGFGVKRTGLAKYGEHLSTADSQAWSYRARRLANERGGVPLPGCTHRSCNSCPRFALAWREAIIRDFGSQLARAEEGQHA